MSSQVLRAQAPAVEAWINLVRGHSAAVGAINARLVADHGLTINDYECLLLLARADERRMRRVDLAEQLILTASGVTRLLDGLERCGYVERGSCDSDRRVVYAVLTDAGAVKLDEASSSHLPQIEGLFAARYDTEEIEGLASLLVKLAEGDTPPCDA